MESVSTLSPIIDPKKEHAHDVTLEDALSISGLGRYHKMLVLVGGLCYLSAGFQNSLNAYILPSVRCDMQVSSSMMGLFNAVFLAGGLSSGFLWGALVDNVGRRPVLVSGMAADSLFTLLSSLSHNFYLLIFFRFLNGFVVGGPAAIILAYIGEFHPASVRSQIICYVGFFWTLSWVILPGVAWVVIPVQWSVELGWVRYTSWRLLISLMAIPSLLSAIFLARLPESPRYLVAKGRHSEALKVLAHVFSVNTGLPSSHYPVKSLETLVPLSSIKMEATKSAWRPLLAMLRQCQCLFVPPVLPVTIMVCYLYFANMFGYYGLGLWLPELVNRFEVHYSMSNKTVSVCQLTGTEPAEAGSCEVTPTAFKHSLLIGSVGLLGNLLSGLLAPRLSRPTMPVVFMTTAGASVLALYFVTSSLQNLIVSAVFQLCIGTANMVYNALVVDMFPSEASGMAVCISIIFGRFGAMVSNLVFGHLLDISCSVPLLLCATIILSGGLVSCFIPKEPYDETSHKQKTVIIP